MLNNLEQLKLIKDLFSNGIDCLRDNKESVNAINVFPVADKDTGSNMYNTLKLSYDDVKDIEDLQAFLDTFSEKLLLNARGNSGILLATLLAGIFDTFLADDKISINRLSVALAEAHVRMCSALENPVKGTIITAFESAAIASDGNYSTLEEFFNVFSEKLNLATTETKYQMQLLEDNGVVDSGALGLLHIVYGMKRVFSTKLNVATLPVPENSMLFCINVSFTKNDKYKEEVLRKALTSLGDSLILQKRGDTIKIHIHSYWPGMVLNLCQNVGVLSSIIIDKAEEDVETLD